jgi:hypothetical protein
VLVKERMSEEEINNHINRLLREGDVGRAAMLAVNRCWRNATKERGR